MLSPPLALGVEGRPAQKRAQTHKSDFGKLVLGRNKVTLAAVITRLGIGSRRHAQDVIGIGTV